jgi:hypothetical protein
MNISTVGLYAGLTNLKLLSDWEEFDLGEGLFIRPTYAHLMVSNTMAFNSPAKPGMHHPAPWKATSQHEAFDVHAELFIPSSYKPKNLTHYEVARTIVVMMRLFCDPQIRFLVRASHSLSEIAKVPDREIQIDPIESTPMYFSLDFADPTDLDGAASRLYWVRNYWQNAVDLMGSHADFRLAMEAFEMSTFIPHHALTLVSLWGALEVLFSPSTSELRFRVSVLIAAYVYPAGHDRARLQKEIFDLYDKRSAAAHGKPKHNTDHLLQTFNIVQRVLKRMIEEKEVPTKMALNDLLMGVDAR